MQTLDLLFVSTMDCKGRGTNAIHRCLPLCPCITQYFRYITSYLSQILILMYTQQRIVFVNTNQQKIGRLPVLYAFPQYVKKGCLIKCPSQTIHVEIRTLEQQKIREDDNCQDGIHKAAAKDSNVLQPNCSNKHYITEQKETFLLLAHLFFMQEQINHGTHHIHYRDSFGNTGNRNPMKNILSIAPRITL